MSELKAKVLLFVQKRTCSFSVAQSSSNLSFSVPLGDLDQLKSLQCSLLLTWINVVIILCLFVKSSMFLQFSLSLIPQLVHMWSLSPV